MNTYQDYTFQRGTLKALGLKNGDRVAWRLTDEGAEHHTIRIGVLAVEPTWVRLVTDKDTYPLGGTATKHWMCLAPLGDSAVVEPNDVVRLSLSARLVQDMTPFLEDAFAEAQEGKGAQAEGVIALWHALEQGTPSNGGRSLVIDLPRVGLLALEDVAVYRAEYHAPVKRNAYGVEDPCVDTRIAAERVIRIVQEALNA